LNQGTESGSRARGRQSKEGSQKSERTLSRELQWLRVTPLSSGSTGRSEASGKEIEGEAGSKGVSTYFSKTQEVKLKEKRI
jgi:hypothetical protein